MAQPQRPHTTRGRGRGAGPARRTRSGGPARSPSRRSLLTRLGAVVLAVLFAGGLAAILLRGRGEAASSEHPAFDGGAALRLVERQVAFGPRVPNTPAHDRMLAFLRESLRPLADSLAVEEFTHVTAQGDTLRLANVIASFEPRARSRIMLAAHWDSRPVGEKDADPSKRGQPIPGANDGGSGVAVLLQIARVISKNPLPEGYGVDLVFLDGEDYGHDPKTFATRGEDMYLGAKHFAEAHAAYRPLFAILIDLVGDRQPLFLQEGYSLDYAPEVVQRVWQAARDLGYGEAFQERPLGYITDDHFYLNQAGIRTVDIIDFDYPAWHTSGDTPDKMSAGTLEMVGNVLLEVIYNRL